MKEETGLANDDIRFAIVQDWVNPPEFYKPAHFILLNYTCRSRGGAVTLNDEAQEFQWIAPRAALALPLNTPTRILIEHALSRKA